jgi:NTP pyrophosphatase (non-canonical NTP hydrolase)
MCTCHRWNPITKVFEDVPPEQRGKMQTAEAHNAPLVGKVELGGRREQLQMMVDKARAENGMGMNEYQKLAEVTVVYPPDLKVIYPTIGLAGETGEVCEKVKKWIRDADRKPMTQEQLDLLKKELGDVLWYLAVLAKDLGLSLDEIAQDNIRKLHDRKARGVVHGKGDVR